MLGERVDTPTNRSFVACSHFEQTILGGQLCYSLDVNRVAKSNSGAGRGNGLLLLIDPVNPEQKDKYKTPKSNDHMITTLNIEQTKTNTQGIKIYINTLEKFDTFDFGSFAMRSLKKMTGTEAFLENTDKDCYVETFENCQARRYLEEVTKHCGCVPWSLATINPLKVQ